MKEKNVTGGGSGPAATRAVVLAGATGLVGRAVLEGLLADSTVAAVHALGRREPGVSHPKLTTYIVDFKTLPPLPPVDEVYLALGTTIKAAGSQTEAAQRLFSSREFRRTMIEMTRELGDPGY